MLVLRGCLVRQGSPEAGPKRWPWVLAKGGSWGERGAAAPGWALPSRSAHLTGSRQQPTPHPARLGLQGLCVCEREFPSPAFRATKITTI